LGLSNYFFLNWVVLAISLFNTILLLWLGMTVLLNAERRTPGLWIAGSMLLLGGIFFLSHSAILGFAPAFLNRGVNFWWRLGWLPTVLLPLAWYVVMLWYAGFWSQPASRLRQKHTTWLWLSVVFSIIVLGIFFFANPAPTLERIPGYQLEPTPSLGAVPLLIPVYLIYILLCISLSLDALRQPAQSERVMGDVARLRARPWLITAAVLMLLVCFLVGWAMFSILSSAQHSHRAPEINSSIAWFDLIIASLIGVTIIVVGQAIVSYEVFTGKALPRRGLARYWRRILILAAGYSCVISLGITLPLQPIFVALLGMLLMVVFYALLSWRSFEERERTIHGLRPFVASQRLFDQLASHADTPASRMEFHAPFYALCEQVLGAKTAYLVPMGAIAPLVGPALVYPPENSLTQAPGLELADRLSSEQTLCIAVDPQQCNGATWATALWNERGITGILLLGEKRDHSLYTQEEIEIAQATGERLLDALASAELARRLVDLQRHRLAETQVLDFQTRRILHDEILPELHTAMIKLGNPESDQHSIHQPVLDTLSSLHRQIANLLQGMPASSLPKLQDLDVIGGLKHLVNTEYQRSFDQVEWQIQPDVHEHITKLPSFVVEVLFYAAREAIRNAARYARPQSETQPLHLLISINFQDRLTLTVQDNGAGIAPKAASKDSSGQGLALHNALLAVIGGSMEVQSEPGMFTRVVITV